MFGWRDKIVDDAIPTAACYRLKLPMTPENGDRCEEPYEEKSTQFIRVATAYGICGATYVNQSDIIIKAPAASPQELVSGTACQIQ